MRKSKYYYIYIFLALGIASLLSLTSSKKTDKDILKETGNEQAELNTEKQWWHEARFGMFIHWGLYAVPANDSEWHMRTRKKSIAEYSQYAKQFNPIKFNADEWAELAKEAGMKYVVITAKHHDGFALFKSEASHYNMVDATPFKRDIIKELSEACPNHNVRFGVYYSLLSDWGHPGGAIGEPAWDTAQLGNFDDYFNNIAYRQVKELLTNYGPVSELWFDTDGPLKPTPTQQEKIFELTKHHPQMIVNNRCTMGDFDVAEGHGYAQAPITDFELCNNIIMGSWGYRKNYKPENVRSVPELIRELIDVASQGGNYLLNVGPKADGTLTDEETDRLKGIGKWMKINGEAIYGTEKSPFDFLSWGRCTRKKDTLFLHIFDWPSNGKISLPITNRVKSAWLLSGKSSVQYQTVNGRLELKLPSNAPDSVASVVALKVEGEIKPVHSLAYNKPSFGSMDHRNSRNALDLDPYTYWDVTTPVPAWLLVDLKEETTFNTVRIGLSSGTISKFSLKYLKDGQWETIFIDENLLKGSYIRQFPMVTSNKVCFNIEEFDSSRACGVSSFELFNSN